MKESTRDVKTKMSAVIVTPNVWNFFKSQLFDFFF